MGWLKRHWQDDEETVARMQSRYAASEDGDVTKDKKPAAKADKDKGDKSKKDGGK